MCSKTKHNEIGVGTTQAVMGIWVMVRLCSLSSDVVHNLVLAFARHVCIRKDHRYASPRRVGVESMVDVVTQTVGKSKHELCAWSDAVTVKMSMVGFVRWNFKTSTSHLIFNLIHFIALLLALFGGAESPRPLLIHLGTWRHSVYGHVQETTWPNYCKQPIDVLKDVYHHLILVGWCGLIFRMAAWMDYAIHVEIEVVKLDVVGIW